MIRKTLGLAAVVATLIVPPFASARQLATGAELTLGAPAVKAEFIIDGAVWTCDGAVCRSRFVDDMPALRSCKRVVAETGAVTAFTWRGKTLDAAQLAECNTRAKV